MAAKLAQVRLRSGTAERTCWTEARVRIGDQLTLRNSEDPQRRWNVTFIGPERKTATDINRGWNNNI